MKQTPWLCSNNFWQRKNNIYWYSDQNNKETASKKCGFFAEL